MISVSPRGLPQFRDHLGEERILACRLPTAEHRLRFPRFAEAHPLIARKDWYGIDRRSLCPWILDQDGHGSCVGNGSSAGLRRARRLTGASDVPLSPACLYAQINGGQDEGAVISDALDALQKVGTCTFDLVGQDPIYLNRLPASWQQQAARFKIDRAYHATTFEEIASGLLLGFIPVFGFMVGNSFEHFDKYGVAGHDAGPGNHAVHADGLALLPDGRWVLDVVNSWSGSWGPFGNGRMYLDQQHIDGGGDQPDAYLIQAPLIDPEDPLNPPKAA